MTPRVRRLVLFAVALVCGLVGGFLLAHRPTQAPPPSATAPPPTPALESGPRITAEVQTPAPDESWILIAPASLGRAQPPADVDDCATLFDWAITRGAAITTPTRYVVDLHVDELTVLEWVAFGAVQTSTEEITVDEPWARLLCRPDATSEIVWPDTSDALEVPVEPEEPAFQYPPTAEAVGPDRSLRTEILVSPMAGATGPYSYSIIVQVSLAGSLEKRPVELTGPVLRGSDNGGGMGYVPPAYEWTMSPTPSKKYCPAIEDTGPGKDVPAPCTPA